MHHLLFVFLLRLHSKDNVFGSSETATKYHVLLPKQPLLECVSSFILERKQSKNILELKMSTFPSEVLEQLASLSGSPTADFSSMDYIGEPWAWVDRLARDNAERHEYLRDSGAAGPMLVDYRESFITFWGQEVSAKLRKILLRSCEEHFSMVAQGLHRRPGYYVSKFKPLVAEARCILDPLYASEVPEEARKSFLGARHLEATSRVPASVRTMGLQLLKARPSQLLHSAITNRPGSEVPTRERISPTNAIATATTEVTTPRAKRGAPVTEIEEARRKRAREQLRAAQNLVPEVEEERNPDAASPSRLQKAARRQQQQPPQPQEKQQKPLTAKQMKQRLFLQKKKEMAMARKQEKASAKTRK
jgi:hypothetical protein